MWPKDRYETATLALVACGVAAIRIVFHALTRFTADDAFITFRYAANLASGLGFVYNHGEPVLGTTTPLFTFLLAACARLGLEPQTGALLVGSVASGLLGVVILQYARSWGFGPWAPLPVLVYALHPRAMAFDSAGMETPLFTLWVTLALYLLHERRTLPAFIAAALAAMTRPEGFLLLAVLIVAALVERRRDLGPGLILAVAIILPWLAYAQGRFGSPIPNSVPAKLALYAGLREISIWDNLVTLLGWHNPFGVALSALALAGAVWLMRDRGLGRWESVWIVSLVGGLSVTTALPFLWYSVPILPVYILFACAPLVMASEQGVLGLLRAPRVIYTAQAAVLLLLLALSPRTVEGYRHEQRVQETVHKSIGIFLREHALPGDLIAAEDIGYIGYFSKGRILDRDGLISPAAVPYNRNGDYLRLILDFQPEWVVAQDGGMISGFLDDPEFTDEYEQRAQFGTPPGRIYKVFRHRTAPTPPRLSATIPTDGASPPPKPNARMATPPLGRARLPPSQTAARAKALTARIPRVVVRASTVSLLAAIAPPGRAIRDGRTEPRGRGAPQDPRPPMSFPRAGEFVSFRPCQVGPIALTYIHLQHL